MKVTLEDLADLSPNMRKVLAQNEDSVDPRDTYWITLQGMIGRDLLHRPATRKERHAFTEKGMAYKAALAAKSR